MLISTHMQDLKDTTQDVHYENFRAQCISQLSHQVLRTKFKRESISSTDSSITETDRLLIQKDEEVCVYIAHCTQTKQKYWNIWLKLRFVFHVYLQIRRMQDMLNQMQEKLKTNTIHEMNKKHDSVIDV